MKPYPDILGYITGGDRVTLNVLQLALTVGPVAVKAGSTFQALLLAQNTSSAHVDLDVTLKLPNRDNNKQKQRFTALGAALSTGLRPGEVGFVALPLACSATTASGKYKLGVTVKAQALTEGKRRRPEGQGPLPEPGQLSPAHQAAAHKLRSLPFSTSRRFGLRNEIEANFSVDSHGNDPTEVIPRKAQFYSLWNLAEDGSTGMLLDHYRSLILNQIFPALESEHVVAALQQSTLQRFEKAGYPLQPVEALFIAKMLGLVIHMGAPGSDQYDYLGSQAFNVAVLFKHPLKEEIKLPHWFDGLIRAIAYNEQQINNPMALIAGRLYDALLQDALPFAFAIVHKTTGEDMGTEADVHQYCESYLQRLQGAMDFGHAYLPLVLGGIVVFDRVMSGGENLDDTLREMNTVLQTRDEEWTEANDLVFLLTKELVNRSMRLFGYQL